MLKDVRLDYSSEYSWDSQNEGDGDGAHSHTMTHGILVTEQAEMAFSHAQLIPSAKGILPNQEHARGVRPCVWKARYARRNSATLIHGRLSHITLCPFQLWPLACLGSEQLVRVGCSSPWLLKVISHGQKVVRPVHEKPSLLSWQLQSRDIWGSLKGSWNVNTLIYEGVSRFCLLSVSNCIGSFSKRYTYPENILVK